VCLAVYLLAATMQYLLAAAYTKDQSKANRILAAPDAVDQDMSLAPNVVNQDTPLTSN
jgi:hypothetical protein